MNMCASKAGSPRHIGDPGQPPQDSTDPEEIRDLCAAFVEGLKAALGHKLYGVYLYGAWAFPEGSARGDVDMHVIVAEPLSDREKSRLGELHRRIAGEFPKFAAQGLDAYYLLLEDARGTAPPRHQLSPDVVDDSWTLHCAHIRAGRCRILYGPHPGELYPEPSWEALAEALQGELDYVAEHLADYPAYCVLNLCRLIYSFKTGDVVVSKFGSSMWAREAFTDKKSCIDAAMKMYEGSATAAESRRVESEVVDFFRFASERISEDRSPSQAACQPSLDEREYNPHP